MNNLYIVNTPLHMLTAYVLANSYTAGMNNQLFLINPKGYPSWGRSLCLTKMSTDQDTWSRITLADKVHVKQDLKSKGLKGLLHQYKSGLTADGKVDQVYLASDKILFNQLAVELAGNTTYIRFDEGSGSYFSVDRKWTTKISEYLLLQLLRFTAGLKSDMQYNFSGIGAGKDGTADYLYKPHLLERFSPKTIGIDKPAISLALQKLTPMMGEYEELAGRDIVMYLGSPLVEHNFINAESELQLLCDIQKMAHIKGMKFLYKPHPSEQQYKLEKYRRELPNMRFFNSFEPIEIILHKYSNVKALMSFGSSAMLFAELFSRNQELVMISTFCLTKVDEQRLKQDQKAAYLILKNNMKKSGVAIPETMDELQEKFNFQ